MVSPLTALVASGDIDGEGLQDLIAGRTFHPPGSVTVLRNVTLPPFSMDRNSNGIPDDCEQGTFRRGDVVVDGALDLSDAIQILGSLFLGNLLEGCPDAADADDDGQVGITDPLRLLRSLFLGDGPLPRRMPAALTRPTITSPPATSRAAEITKARRRP